MPAPAVVAPLLWSLCDILRDDGITYHQYINEISYLLFLKMAEEAGFENALPDGCSWRVLASAPTGEQFNVYRRMLVTLGTEGDGVVKDIFANPTSLIRRSSTLELLVAGIDKIDWHDTRSESFGDLYEELLAFSAEKRSGAGQYFTPRPLVEAIVQVVNPRPSDVIQDPALGTGGFLVAAHQCLQSRGESASYVGVELVPENFRLALMNTFLHGMGGAYYLQDTLSPFADELPPASLVLTNPPFGSKRGGGGPTRTDLPFSTSNKQLAFLMHIVKTLGPGGRAAVVVPDNVLFESNVGRLVRTYILAECNLHTILRLPTGIFYAPGVKTNVLFFTRNVGGEVGTKETWVYDLRAGMPAFGRRTPLRRQHFHEFEKAFGNDPFGRPESLALRQDEGEEGRFRRFTREWIATRGDNLDISWLKDDTDAEGSDPLVLTRAAIADVTAVLDELRVILEELGEASE